MAGIVWEIGVLCGIGDVDPELLTSLRQADVIIGTSAGAAVAAQITSGARIDDLFAAQLSERSSELEVELDLEELMARFVTATTGATGPEDMRRRIGALALDTATVDEPTRPVSPSPVGYPRTAGPMAPLSSPRSTPKPAS